MWMVDTLFYHFNHQHSIHKSFVTISYNNIQQFKNLFLCSMLSTLYARPAVSASTVVCLRPLTEVICLLSVLYIVYVKLWLFHVTVYTNQMSRSLDCPGQDRLLNWSSGAPQPLGSRRMLAFAPSYCIRNADCVASSHSTPFPGGILFIVWVRIVWGN